MKENKTRKTIRLQEYDYSQNGFYFITICTQCYKCLFGKVVDDEVVLNNLGKIAEEEWFKTEKILSNVKMDKFIVRSNNIHGIICIENENLKFLIAREN